METMEEMFRLNISTLNHPKKVILAHCSRCGNEVDHITWKGPQDRLVKKKQILGKHKRCPFCKARYK